MSSQSDEVLQPEDDGDRPRLDLVEHIKQQIETDPEAYSNDAKFKCCLDKVLADLQRKEEFR